MILNTPIVAAKSRSNGEERVFFEKNMRSGERNHVSLPCARIALSFHLHRNGDMGGHSNRLYLIAHVTDIERIEMETSND